MYFICKRDSSARTTTQSPIHVHAHTRTCTGSRRVTMSLTVGCAQANHRGNKLRPLCSQYSIAGVASPVIKLHAPPSPLLVPVLRLLLNGSVVASTSLPLLSAASTSSVSSPCSDFPFPEAFLPMRAKTLLAPLCSWLFNERRRRPHNSLFVSPFLEDLCCCFRNSALL